MSREKGPNVKTTELAPQQTPRPAGRTGWRDLIASAADHTAIEGFALEQLIDHQRGLAQRDGAGR